MDRDLDNEEMCYPSSGQIIRGPGVRLPQFTSQLLGVSSVILGKKVSVKWGWIRKRVVVIGSRDCFIGIVGGKNSHPDVSHFCSDTL